MESSGHPYTLIILFVGMVIIVNLLIKGGLTRIHLPPLVGFLFIGCGMRFLNSGFSFITPFFEEIFYFLGKIGLVCLLFRVGMESNLKGLIKQLKLAGYIWILDVIGSGIIGYATCRYLLDIELMPSMVVAFAFTATSVGVTVAVWRNARALNTRQGELLVDIAELDDISAVVLMGLLFAIIPVISGDGSPAVLPVAGKTVGIFLGKLLGFGLFCYLFSKYAERHITKAFEKITPDADLIIAIVAVGFLISAFAAEIGFSLAIGAFFAGLVFSRDPECIKMETAFVPIHDFFSPFFFIGIGLAITPDAFFHALGTGLVLFAAAALSKMIAVGGPVSFLEKPITGLLVGTSMVPRAEIAMVIMHQSLQMDNSGVTRQVFSAMVIVTALTCLLSPVVVRLLFQKFSASVFSDITGVTN